MKDKRHRYFLSLVLLVCFLLPAHFVRAEEPAATVTFTNAPDEKPYLEIQKEVTAEPDAAVPDATFYFYVEIKDAGGSYQPYRNQPYTVLDANGETVKDNSGNDGDTGGNAMVALKAGQTARFEYVGVNKEYRIEEIGRAEQTTKIEGQTSETIDLAEYFRCEFPADGVALGTIGPNGATARFTNRYSSKTESGDGALTVQKKISYPGNYQYEGDETFGFTLVVGRTPAKSESYQIRNLETGVTVSGGKTDENGHFTLKADEAAVFLDLEGNQDYQVTEDAGPKGWRCVGKDSYTGSTSDHATVTFMNTNASFTVTKKLQKTADDGTEFTFQLFDGERKTWANASYWRYTTGGELADSEIQKTDANGCFSLQANQAAMFVEISPGTVYSVRELAPGELGYVQRTPADASGYMNKKVTESGTEILSFVNERLERKGSLTVTKKLTYAVDGEAPLSGAERMFTFRICEAPNSSGSGEEAAPVADVSYTLGADSRQYKTNENGEFSLREGETAVFAGLPFREYQVEEVNLEPGYSIREEMQKQTGNLTDSGTLSFTFDNVYTARHFDLKIAKVDDSGTQRIGLQGAKFMVYTDEELTAPYGTLTERTPLVTDSTGNVTLSDLREGTYYLKEVAAPTGYVMMTDPVRMTVTRVLDQDGREKLAVETKQAEGAVISAEIRQTPAENPSDAHDMLEITIKNDQGRLYALPSTGGPGTGFLTGIGLLMMIAAAVLALVRRNKTK